MRSVCLPQHPAVAYLYLVRPMDARVAKTLHLLLAMLCPLIASTETDYATELKRQVTEDRGPH